MVSEMVLSWLVRNKRAYGFSFQKHSFFQRKVLRTLLTSRSNLTKLRLVVLVPSTLILFSIKNVGDGTRTHKMLLTWTWIMRVYQFRHSDIIFSSSDLLIRHQLYSTIKTQKYKLFYFMLICYWERCINYESNCFW